MPGLFSRVFKSLRAASAPAMKTLGSYASGASAVGGAGIKAAKIGVKTSKAFSKTVGPIREQTKKVLSYRVVGGAVGRSARFGYKSWKNLPKGARDTAIYAGKVVGLHALGAGVAVAGTIGLVNGWREGFMTAEAMHNQAHGYGAFGNESNFRNNGRMPSNHLGHAGIGLNMSRLRHG